VAKFVVASVDEIPPGGRKIVDVNSRSIGVFNLNGDYFALLNRCPHQGGPLCNGELWSAVEGDTPGEYRSSRTGEIVACPWHGWEFDIRTGQSWCDPERLRVRVFDVEMEHGAALVGAAPPTGGRIRGPYVAETYPVSVEGDYLVVDMSPRRQPEP